MQIRRYSGSVDWDARVDMGPPVTIWIRIPSLPPSLNFWSRQHWRVRHQLVDEMSRNMTHVAAWKKLPRLERMEVRVVYYFRDSRHRDPDNYNGKIILDGLRHAGIISEDHAGVLRLPQAEFQVDSKAPRTEVWIRELSDHGT